MKVTSSQFAEVTRASDWRALTSLVERFSEEMKFKLGQKLNQGRSGWDKEEWSKSDILKALREHLDKGNMVDVANYAMFLWNRTDAEPKKKLGLQSDDEASLAGVGPKEL